MPNCVRSLRWISLDTYTVKVICHNLCNVRPDFDVWGEETVFICRTDLVKRATCLCSVANYLWQPSRKSDGNPCRIWKWMFNSVVVLSVNIWLKQGSWPTMSNNVTKQNQLPTKDSVSLVALISGDAKRVVGNGWPLFSLWSSKAVCFWLHNIFLSVLRQEEFREINGENKIVLFSFLFWLVVCVGPKKKTREKDGMGCDLFCFVLFCFVARTRRPPEYTTC